MHEALASGLIRRLPLTAAARSDRVCRRSEDLTFAHATWLRGGTLKEVGGCSGTRALSQAHPKQWRDGCASIEREVFMVRGDRADELVANSRSSASTQYHNRPGHYSVRSTLCECLAQGRVASAEELLACAQPSIPTRSTLPQAQAMKSEL
jgi:hypothetical protein